MPTETPRPEGGETLKDLARRAGSIAQNSNLVSINLFSIAGGFVGTEAPDEETELELASEHHVEHSLTPESEDDPAKLAVLLHFHVQIRPVTTKQPVFKLQATFHANYLMNRGMPEEAHAHLDAFSQTNAVIHSWPYFRELVQSTLWRCGLPPFPLPLFRITDEKAASMQRRSPSKSN